MPGPDNDRSAMVLDAENRVARRTGERIVRRIGIERGQGCRCGLGTRCWGRGRRGRGGGCVDDKGSPAADRGRNAWGQYAPGTGGGPPPRRNLLALVHPVPVDVF
jgi:hypothetical protein